MKQSNLFHPRIFDDQKWSEGYYNRNAKNITRVGKRLAKLLKKCGFSDGKILDVGCGFASVPIEIAKVFPNVEIIGIDLGNSILDIGQTLVNKAGLTERIILKKGDAQDLQFEKNSFDVVINSFLLHIVEKPLLMLNEIERVTKSNGQILITDLRRGFLANFIKKFRTAFTLEEALDTIKKSNIREGIPSTGPFWWDYTSILEDTK